MDRRRFPPDEEVAPRAWAGLAVVAAALFVATLDAMVLYVAFGTIRRDFPDVSAAALSWILSGYTIVLAAGVITAGPLAALLRPPGGFFPIDGGVSLGAGDLAGGAAAGRGLAPQGPAGVSGP